jgi:hypothetical protein
MSEKRKCNCEFCRLHALRTEALKSDDIQVVKDALTEFSDLWLFVSEDLSYYKCIMDGSWPTADVLLTDALEKFKNHPNRELENG